MRIPRLTLAALALGLSVLGAGATVGRADETFVCADGSSVTIDDDNRAAMQDHPCVKAWFANDRAARQAKAEQGGGEPGSGTQPVLYRDRLWRRNALRDLRQRPAYLAWSRARAVQVRPTARSNGTIVRSPPGPPLGVTIRVPAGQR